MESDARLELRFCFAGTYLTMIVNLKDALLGM